MLNITKLGKATEERLQMETERVGAEHSSHAAAMASGAGSQIPRVTGHKLKLGALRFRGSARESEWPLQPEISIVSFGEKCGT